MPARVSGSIPDYGKRALTRANIHPALVPGEEYLGVPTVPRRAGFKESPLSDSFSCGTQCPLKAERTVAVVYSLFFGR